MPNNLPGEGVPLNIPNPPVPNALPEPLRPTPWGYDPAKLLRYILDVLAEGGPQAAERARAWAQARLDELVGAGAPIITDTPTSTAPLPKWATTNRGSSTSCCATSSSTTSARPLTEGTL